MPLGSFRLNTFGQQALAPATVTLDAVQIVQSSSAYWVTNTSVTKSITNNKTITFSAWVNVDNFTNRKAILNLRTINRAPILFVVNTTGTVRILSNGGESDQTVLDATTSSAVITAANTWYHIAGSIDLSNTSNRSIYINGSPVTVTYSTYQNANINLNVAFNVGIGNNAETSGSAESGFKFSQIWFDNSYIDLSSNISKFYNLGPVDMGATGTSSGLSQPLIYHYGNTTSATTIRTNRGRSSGVYASYTLGAVGTPSNATGPTTVARLAKVITPTGNAQVSTAQSKFGGASALFDGTGDYLQVSNSSSFTFGNNDFTIEFWIRLTTNTGTRIIWDQRPSGSQGLQPTIYQTNGTLYYYTNAGNRITSTSTLADSTWYHIAVSRSGTSTRMFINGTQTGSTYTDSNNYVTSSAGAFIGADQFSTGSNSVPGHIDEFRVSDIARYTANFTAPTAAFTNDSNTLLLLHMDGTNASTSFIDDNAL